MRDDRAYAAVVAVFATFLYLALVVAAFGLISLATDTEVISDPSAGPLVGPVMTGAAVLTLFAFLLVDRHPGPGRPAAHRRRASLSASGSPATSSSSSAGGVAGAAGDPSKLLHYFLFAAAQLGSWYAITVGDRGRRSSRCSTSWCWSAASGSAAARAGRGSATTASSALGEAARRAGPHPFDRMHPAS